VAEPRRTLLCLAAHRLSVGPVRLVRRVPLAAPAPGRGFDGTSAVHTHMTDTRKASLVCIILAQLMNFYRGFIARVPPRKAYLGDSHTAFRTESLMRRLNREKDER
jgi:hypothetical protein